MTTNEPIFPTLPYGGIQIVLTQDVAPGCKRTDPYGAILVNAANYEILRTLTPRSLLVALAVLREEFANE